jgi:ABC-2 type transporter
LLLRKGGQVVYHGELGKDCGQLVSYFESRGAPEIELGDNPANWMLRVLEAPNVGDLAESYLMSPEHASLVKALDDIATAPDPDLKLSYESEFAAATRSRRLYVNGRLQTIYWRSPSYNLSRLTVSLVIAFVLGSVFVTKRSPPAFSESDMRARLSVVFLAFIISGIQAILSVVPVMTMIRDLYYRHRDAGMYDSGSIGLALGVAEKAFILVSTAIFTIVFLATSGLAKTEATFRGSIALAVLGRSAGFWVRL